MITNSKCYLWKESREKQAHETTPSRSQQGHCHPFLSLHCLSEGGNVKKESKPRGNKVQSDKPTKKEAPKIQ